MQQYNSNLDYQASLIIKQIDWLADLDKLVIMHLHGQQFHELYDLLDFSALFHFGDQDSDLMEWWVVLEQLHE